MSTTELVGNRWESPALLPKRTRAAIADLQKLIDMIPGKINFDLFSACRDAYEKSGFSENLVPVQFEAPEDVFDLFSSILLLSFRKDNNPVFICLLAILSLSEQRPVAVTRCDVELFANFLSNPDNVFLRSVVKKIRFVVKHRLCMYIDHSGGIFLRDNCEEAVGQVLSLGVETGRTVKVSCKTDALGQDEVGLVGFRDEDYIFELRKQTNHHPALLAECRSILMELSNIIPMPRETDQLALLPSESVKKYLKDGRASRKRRSYSRQDQPG